MADFRAWATLHLNSHADLSQQTVEGLQIWDYSRLRNHAGADFKPICNPPTDKSVSALMNYEAFIALRCTYMEIVADNYCYFIITYSFYIIN